MAIYHPPARPHGLLRLGFKLPIALYRVRLGWLLGHRFLLLTHRGRTSGRIYQTVLEVVHHDPATHESAALSAWGERADWYQNILAHPAIEVRTDGNRYTPQYRLLGPDERFTTVRQYEKRYGLVFRAVIRAFGYQYDGSDASLRALADAVLIVAFRPREVASR
ncbi:MAG TPA: nitroreductase family deazaflavin-dependent oxidoreductase [Ktedonobacterales bacterium]|jgi:deazaflavin-dependent oxidoreductase (nitroreductase family)